MSALTFRKPLNKNLARIVIVGGGISGLSAAESLIRRGFQNVMILEASDQLGGRIRTAAFGDGWVEVGAQWLHGQGDNVAFDYAARHRLVARDDPNAVLDLQHIDYMTDDGRRLDNGVASSTTEAVQQIMDDIRHSRPPKYSAVDAKRGGVRDYLQDRFLHDVLAGCRTPTEATERRLLLRWYERMQCSIEGCDSLSEMSMASYSVYRECAGNSLCNLAAGYSSLVSAVAATIPHGCVRLRSPVRHIRLLEPGQVDVGPVTVVLEDGDRLVADHVLVTVSLGVLKQSHEQLFSPQLSREKKEAIRDIGFGTVNKIFLEFEKPFWPSSSAGYALLWDDVDSPEVAASASWERGLLGFFVVPFATNVLCGWMVGAGARQMETLDDSEVRDTCLTVLRRFTGKRDLPPLIKMLRSRWHSNPRVLGSYSYLNSRLAHPDRANSVLAEPVNIQLDDAKHPAILFAGEATHPYYYSTVHGAMETGVREADRIVNYYRNNSSSGATSPGSKL